MSIRSDEEDEKPFLDASSSGPSGFKRIRKRFAARLMLLSLILLMLFVIILKQVNRSQSLAPKYGHPIRYEDYDHEAENLSKTNEDIFSKLPTEEANGINFGKYKVCNTKECNLAAEAMLEAIDQRIDPCDDFYQFACGNWMKKNPVPAFFSEWSRFHKVGYEIIESLIDIIESPLKVSDQKSMEKLKDYYKDCTDTSHLEILGVTPLTDNFEQFGGWPMAVHKWNAPYFEAISLLGGYLIKVTVSPDQRNSTRNAIYIDQPTLSIPQIILRNPGSYENWIAAYKTYLARTATILATSMDQNVDDATLNADISAVLNFEINIATISTLDEERIDINRQYNPLTISEVRRLTGGSSIIWNTLSNSVLSLYDEVNEATIIVKEVEYVKQLATLLNVTSSRTIANYLMWRYVQSHGEDSNDAMRNVSFQYTKIIAGVSSPTPRSFVCASKANDKFHNIGTEYVKSHISMKAYDEVSLMVTYIRKSFSVFLSLNKWIDEKEKLKIRDKASSIIALIGPIERSRKTLKNESYNRALREIFDDTHLHNGNMLRQRWNSRDLRFASALNKKSVPKMSQAIVNAFYFDLHNTMVFPMGIMQPPFYQTNVVRALNFGAIGEIIGHELIHAFDVNGIQRDQSGNQVPWLSNSTITAFKKEAQCVVNQYESIKVSDVEDLSSNARLNGVTTLGENIADLGGLRQAFLAYLRYEYIHGEEPRLPKLEHFTPHQLFFLSFAQSYCSSYTREGLQYDLLVDNHSPARYRVLGAMKNMPEFSATWKCSSTAPMNPPNKCLIW